MGPLERVEILRKFIFNIVHKNPSGIFITILEDNLRDNKIQFDDDELLSALFLEQCYSKLIKTEDNKIFYYE